MPRANYKRSICHAANRTARHSSGLVWVCLTIHKRRNHARRGLVYHATNTTAAGKAGLLDMRSIRQELHAVNICGPVYHAAKEKRSAAVNRRQLATTRAGLFRMQASNAARRNHAATDSCSASQAMQIRPESRCTGFAESPYIHPRNTLQELQAAISNGLAAFRSTPGNAAQGIPDRPPGIDTLRLYADGVELL